jgi:hypothetical protein
MAMVTASDEYSLTPIKFHFFKLSFTPYNSNKHEETGGIVNKVINFLSKQRLEGKGILIDRHEGRKNDPARPLFVTSTSTMLREKRIRGSIALLRSGKIPMVKPADKFMLIPFDTSRGEIAEQTHFFIDYSTNEVILCVEYNYNGPRVSDLEYYFRIVARDELRIAKATDVEVFMDTSIDRTLADLKSVLNFEIKVQPQKLSQLDTDLVGQYFTGITTLANRVKPNFIKLEALFQTPGKQYEGAQLNKEAVTMVTRFLKSFKARPTNINVFEDFVVKYEDKDGREEFFNLLKGKKEVIKRVDLKTIKGSRQFYELIEPDITEFVQSLSQ